VQLESHATPPQESPQLRYAALHRAIERGLDSDEIWKDLADICLELGHQDEAVRCLRRMPDGTLRRVLESRLTRLGLVSAPAPARPRGEAVAKANAANHATAPAASDAGPEADSTPAARDRFDASSLREHMADAVQFVFQQHMPWLVLLTTLAFPLVVGLGGFLTAGGSPLLLAGLAAVPGLCVLAVVGAMGRLTLLDSSQGSCDVPAIPELGRLVTEAKRFLVDAVLVLGSLLAPSVIALALGAPLAPTLPGLLLGAFFTPLAWGLRQVRGDFGALSPVTLLRGAGRTGVAYVALAAVCWGLFAPAALVAFAVFGRPVWVQIAVIGPLTVLPLFVASRLVGTWLDVMRLELGFVLLGPNARNRSAAAATPAAAPAERGSRPEQHARRHRGQGLGAQEPRRRRRAAALTDRWLRTARRRPLAAERRSRHDPRPWIWPSSCATCPTSRSRASSSRTSRRCSPLPRRCSTRSTASPRCRSGRSTRSRRSSRAGSCSACRWR
jgi:hypothetical protein